MIAHDAASAVIAQCRLVAVLRATDSNVARELAAGAIAGGVRVVEVTTTIPDVFEQVTALVDEGVSLVGAGTVLDAATVRRAADAGARFVVSPSLDPAVLDAAADVGLLAIPGVLTPTELDRARARGLPLAKLFPASTVGVEHLRALRSVFSDIGIVPTGGVDAGDVGAWLEAGATAVGVGGALNAAHRIGGTAAVQDLCQQLVRTATGPTSDEEDDRER